MGATSAEISEMRATWKGLAIAGLLVSRWDTTTRRKFKPVKNARDSYHEQGLDLTRHWRLCSALMEYYHAACRIVAGRERAVSEHRNLIIPAMSAKTPDNAMTIGSFLVPDIAPTFNLRRRFDQSDCRTTSCPRNHAAS